jgi:uncharacterized phage protein (TIGR02218 family)
MSVQRSMSVALAAHLQKASTTTTRLLKITLPSGLIFGLSMLDKDIAYDDGTTDGEINYAATNGFDISNLSAEAAYTVGNAEAQSLVAGDVDGVTVEMVEAGDLDNSSWVCYLVNFEDLSMGHVEIGRGDVGEVITKFGMVWLPELLDYIARLRQPIGQVWSIACRAEHGSPANSPTGCGVDISATWVSGTVVSVGVEPDRLFTGSAVATGLEDGYPGRVQFLTGDNAGHEFATETVEGSTVTLLEFTPRPISAGDTYRIRRACKKRYEEDCIGIYNNGLNFKGEPNIPVGDALQTQAPGAQVAVDRAVHLVAGR